MKIKKATLLNSPFVKLILICLRFYFVKIILRACVKPGVVN